MITYGNALYIMLCVIVSLAFLSVCKGSSVVAQGKTWDYIYWGSYFNATSYTMTTYTLYESALYPDGTYFTSSGKVICIGNDDFVDINAF